MSWKHNIDITSHELIKSRATNLPTEHIIKFLYGQIQKKYNFCYENFILKVKIAVFLAFLEVTVYREATDSSKRGKIWGFNAVDRHYVKE